MLTVESSSSTDFVGTNSAESEVRIRCQLVFDPCTNWTGIEYSRYSITLRRETFSTSLRCHAGRITALTCSRCLGSASSLWARLPPLIVHQSPRHCRVDLRLERDCGRPEVLECTRIYPPSLSYFQFVGVSSVPAAPSRLVYPLKVEHLLLCIHFAGP